MRKPGNISSVDKIQAKQCEIGKYTKRMREISDKICAISTLNIFEIYAIIALSKETVTWHRFKKGDKKC